MKFLWVSAGSTSPATLPLLLKTYTCSKFIYIRLLVRSQPLSTVVLKQAETLTDENLSSLVAPSPALTYSQLQLPSRGTFQGSSVWQPRSVGLGLPQAEVATETGVGIVFGNLIVASARNPSLKQQLFSAAVPGFAFSEVRELFSPMVAFLILCHVKEPSPRPIPGSFSRVSSALLFSFSFTSSGSLGKIVDSQFDRGKINKCCINKIS